MDPRVALTQWLENSDHSYEAGRDYNELIRRGGYPAIVALENGSAMVLSVSGDIAKTINPAAKRKSIKRKDIIRVTLL